MPKIDLEYGGVDDTSYPIIHLDLDDHEPTIEEVDVLFDAIGEMYANSKGKFVVVADASRIGWVGSQIRIHTAKRSRGHHEEYIDRMVASIAIVPNLLTRTMMKGIDVASPPLVKRHPVASMEEALKLAEKLLAQAGA